MFTLIAVIHVIACVFLILVVLLQAGKGGGIGIAFGSSTSQAVFGGRGAGNFLERITAITAIVFMLTSITLSWDASRKRDNKRLQEKGEVTEPVKPAADAKPVETAPAVPAPAAPAVPPPAGETKPAETAPAAPAAPAAEPKAAPVPAPAAPAPAAPAPAAPVK